MRFFCLHQQALSSAIHATGMRVSECCSITINDVDLFMDTVLVHGKGKKQRYIPFGSYAREALKVYMNSGRQCLLMKAKEPHDLLFVNQRGGPLTARGIRHILAYADGYVKCLTLFEQARLKYV